MKVLKVRSEAFTSSFRYPRIQVGRLPTFDMPPPATIYGHLAGVLGKWFEPDGLEFAYTFSHDGKGIDLETGQPIERGPGKNTLRRQGWDYPVNVVCAPNPQRREFLLRPKLTLYLRGGEELLDRLSSGFLCPEFAYILGRSQDLATCRSAEFVDLGESADVFFSHTLLPYEWRAWVVPGVSVLMPELIDYRRNREARQNRYLQVMWPPLRLHDGSGDTVARQNLPVRFPVDMSEKRDFADRTLARGLWFHTLQGPGTAS